MGQGDQAGRHPDAVTVMDQQANGSGIGQPVRRREDLRLVRGAGRYTADENLPGQAYAVMVRSPHAHARIRGIAKDAALAVPACSPCSPAPISWPTGSSPFRTRCGRSIPPKSSCATHGAEVVHGAALPAAGRQGALCRRGGGDGGRRDRLRREGRRRDASRSTTRCCRPWPRRVAAARQDAPRVHEDARSNVCLDAKLGDAAATDAAFARAAHVTRFETWVQRVTGVPMEPRAALAAFDPRDRPLHPLCRQRRRGAAEGRPRHHPRRAGRKGARA